DAWLPQERKTLCLCPFTLGEDVPPQSNSPSDTVSGANHFKPIADHPL
ncbi:hypothetical protein Tsp_14487, partial [Trichinella spiralis]